MAAAAEQRALLPVPWTVREVTRETADVVTLEVVPGTEQSPPEWRPGHFNMLYVFGVGEVPISISGSGPGSILHTIRGVGPVSRALIALTPGATVGVRGPFGSEWPIQSAAGRDIVVAAGGIGLAPLRPVLEHVMRARDRFDDVVLLYGARTPDDRLFVDSYARWREHRIQVEVTVDHADAGWGGHVGVVTTLIRRARSDAPEASAFLCGPEVMMRFTAQELAQSGVASERTFASMERNMQCAVGHCGHCQLGPEFICLDGPVFPWPRLKPLMSVREL